MNIVIADDEQIILRWLKKNIEELSQDYHVAALCPNGKQALNCCLNQQVDVLFTDIRMPVMDGLELLEKLGANHVMPYTVILSAYSDFSYVRDAFKLGASDYLLKPEITRDNLKECLDSVSRLLKQDQNSSENGSITEKNLCRFMEQYFTDSEKMSDNWIRQYEEEFSAKYRNQFMISVLYSYDQVFHANQVKEIVEMLFQDEKRYVQSFFTDPREVVLVSEVPAEGAACFMKRLYNGLVSFGLKKTAINISAAGNTLQDLEDTYHQAKEVMDTQYFYGKTGVMTYSVLNVRKKQAGEKLEQECKKLYEILENGNWDRLYDNAEQMIRSAAENMPEADYLKHLLMDVLMNIYWNYVDSEQREKLASPHFLALNEAENMEKLGHIFLSQAEQLQKLLEEKKKQHLYSNSVCQVLEYISIHYGQDISLNDLSNYVHLNRSYLSTRFKKEVGVNINVYLLNYRLEKAKELLCSTNNLVQQICDEVGIPDSAYFSKQFKKYSGESPLEFRKNHK